MVTSIQNGRMILLSQEDIEEEQYWAPKLGIEIEDVVDFQSFFIRFSSHKCCLSSINITYNRERIFE